MKRLQLDIDELSNKVASNVSNSVCNKLGPVIEKELKDAWNKAIEAVAKLVDASDAISVEEIRKLKK